MARRVAPKHFLNRELSWLEFNRRVLEEARDSTQPLMERVKFLSIFSSNLDEFFEIRVAGIKQQIESVSDDRGPDGMRPAEVFEAIQTTAHELVRAQYELWNQEIVPKLAQNGIRIYERIEDFGPGERLAKRYFLKEVFPVLTPLAVDASHPFPQLLNKSHNLLVKVRKPGHETPLYAVVQVPKVIPRLITLERPAAVPENPPEGAAPPPPPVWDYIYLAGLIKHFVGELFPGLEVEGVHAFRVTRNSDLYIDEEEAENLLRTIEQELQKASRGKAVRLEVEARCPADFKELLLGLFQLSPADLYEIDGPISMTHLMALATNDAFAKLKDRPFKPAHPPGLPPGAEVLQSMRRKDILLHHPFQSFDVIVDLVEKAACDPAVLAIKITLYRTSGNSPIVASLRKAAANGKQVTALVELKARFDEAANIQWARTLEEAGAHVVYGVVGLKTHCKMLMIVRRDEDRIRRYVHLGTGNYNPSTARIYTDLSLLTCSPGLTQEVAKLFNTLTGVAEYQAFKRLLVAPFDLASRLISKIERERDHARAGIPARIIVKINSLVDEKLIAALYEASSAGVKIDLIVRGISCLRPGVAGVSENIRVISIVGRFLEHSRIYYFANAGKAEVYLSSADWMPRNLQRRIEVAFPIEKLSLRKQLIEEILPAYLNDRVKARELQSDGSYLRLQPIQGQASSQAQLFFRRRSRAQTTPPPVKNRRLTPITKEL